MTFSLFRKNAAPETTKEFAPGTGIAYHPELVMQLHAQHRELVALMTATIQAAKQGNYPQALEGVKRFRADLRDHLILENMKIYTYLEHCLKGGENQALMLGMKREMGGIGQDVMRFLGNYIDHPVDQVSAAKFLEEVQRVMATLGERIGREESLLYTLYKPPSRF